MWDEKVVDGIIQEVIANKDIPLLSAAPQSIQQQEEYRKWKEGYNTDGYNNWDLEFELIDEDNIPQPNDENNDEYLNKQRQRQKEVNNNLNQMIPKLFINNNTTTKLNNKNKTFKWIKFINILTALQYNQLNIERYPAPYKTKAITQKFDV
eukprot:UN03579